MISLYFYFYKNSSIPLAGYIQSQLTNGIIVKDDGTCECENAVTNAPVTNDPVTDAPVTDAPNTDAPVTDAPSTGWVSLFETFL